MNSVRCKIAAGIVALAATTALAAPAMAACTISIPSSPSTSGFQQLQLPIDNNNDGSPDTVSGSSLQSYSSQYMERQGSTNIVFRVPTSGLATTPNSSYPRSELRETSTWRYSNGCSGLAAKVSIYDMPSSGSIVIGQIHQQRSDGQPPRPPLELYYNPSGTITANILYTQTTASGQPREKITLATGIPLKQQFSYMITIDSDRVITMKVNGTTKTWTLSSTFGSANLYFKAGNYTQNSGGGSSVGFQGLRTQH